MKAKLGKNFFVFTRLISLFVLLAVLFWAVGCQWAGWEVDWERDAEKFAVVKINWRIQGQRESQFQYEIECNFGMAKQDGIAQDQPVYTTQAKECSLVGGDVSDIDGDLAKLILDSDQQDLRIIRQGEQYRLDVNYGRVIAEDGKQLDFCDPEMTDIPPILIPSMIMDVGADYEERYNFSLSDYQGCSSVEMKVLLNISRVAEPE